MIYSTKTDKYRNVTAFDGLPIQTVSSKEKQDPAWQAANMDFLESVSHQQRAMRARDLRKYKLLSPDFELKDYAFINDPLSLGNDREQLYGAMDDVKHFPIMNRPINTIMGEMINRPMNFYVISTSAKARNEYYRMKQEETLNYVLSQINQRISQQLINEGADPESKEFPQQIQARTPEEVQDYADKDYLDVAEQVMQRAVKNVYRAESLHSKFIDGFAHVVRCAKEFYHCYTVNHKSKVDTLSPIEVFYHKSPTERRISKSQYAGFERYYTLSSIIDQYRLYLTKEEVEHLEKKVSPNRKKGTSTTGVASIDYNTGTFRDWNGNKFSDYDNQYVDALIDDFQHNGISSTYLNTHGLLSVIQGYWVSYQKIGFLTSYADDGSEVVQQVDEHYEPRTDEGEFVEEMYIKQIYMGTKISDDVYIGIQPDPNQIFDEDDLDSTALPIIGTVYNSYHTEPISPIDLMLPWQELYNIVAHELKKDMKKAVGKVLFMSYDHIPKIPGFSKEKWLYWLREFGIAWVGDSNKRTQFSHYSAQDLSLADQIMAKMQMLDKIKANCDEFAGFSQPRLAKQENIDTVRQSQQAIASSVTQTEYYFYKHYELIQEVLTWVLNTEMINSRYNNHSRNLYDDTEQLFIDYDAGKISAEKLGLFVTNTAEDLRKREELMGAINAAVQRGADPVDFADAILADTRSEIRTILKGLKKERIAAAQAEQQAKQQELELKGKEQADKMALEYARIASQEKIAYMKTFSFPEADNMKDENADGTADILQYQELAQKAEADLRKGYNDQQKLQFDMVKHKDEMARDKRQQDIDLKNQENDLQQTRIQARNKPKAK